MKELHEYHPTQAMNAILLFNATEVDEMDIPRLFVQTYGEFIPNKAYVELLSHGPLTSGYWQAWNDILDSYFALTIRINSLPYTLYQQENHNLWAIPLLYEQDSQPSPQTKRVTKLDWAAAVATVGLLFIARQHLTPSKEILQMMALALSVFLWLRGLNPRTPIYNWFVGAILLLFDSWAIAQSIDTIARHYSGF